MKRRLPALAAALAAAALAVVALGGCGYLGADTDDDAGRPVATGPAPTPSGSAVSGLGAAERPAVGLPDPCSLLSRTDVTGLTGRSVTEVDADDAQPGDPTRYCQWQQDGGQLALFLSRTTGDGFDAAIAQAQPVDGVEGYDAFAQSGHLYVRDDDVEVDVYSRGGADDQNLTEEITVMKAVLPKLERPTDN